MPKILAKCVPMSIQIKCLNCENVHHIFVRRWLYSHCLCLSPCVCANANANVMLTCVISWNTVCYSRNNVFPFAAAVAAAISAGIWKQYAPAQMEIFGKHEPNEMSFTDDVMRGYVHETWAYNQTLNAYFPCPNASKWVRLIEAFCAFH